MGVLISCIQDLAAKLEGELLARKMGQNPSWVISLHLVIPSGNEVAVLHFPF